MNYKKSVSYWSTIIACGMKLVVRSRKLKGHYENFKGVVSIISAGAKFKLVLYEIDKLSPAARINQKSTAARINQKSLWTWIFHVKHKSSKKSFANAVWREYTRCGGNDGRLFRRLGYLNGKEVMEKSNQGAWELVRAKIPKTPIDYFLKGLRCGEEQENFVLLHTGGRLIQLAVHC